MTQDNILFYSTDTEMCLNATFTSVTTTRSYTSSPRLLPLLCGVKQLLLHEVGLVGHVNV